MKREILIEDGIEIDGELWIFTRMYNALCILNTRSGELSYISSIPHEPFCKSRLIGRMIHYAGNIVLLPMTAKKIYIYNIMNNTWLERDIPKVSMHYNQSFKFLEAIIYMEKLFIFGASFPGFLIVDLTSMQIISVKECYSSLSTESTPVVWVRSCAQQCGNQVYFASCASNEVLKINLDNYEHEALKVGSEHNRYSGLVLDEDGVFWLSPLHNTSIVRWDGKDSFCEVPIQGFDEKGFFSGVVQYKSTLFFPRMFSGLSIELKEGRERVLHEVNFSFFKQLNEFTIWQDTLGKLYIWQMLEEEKREISVHFTENISFSSLSKKGLFDFDSVICEDEILCTLGDYFEFVLRGKTDI